MSLKTLSECLHAFSTTPSSTGTTTAIAAVSGKRVSLYRVILIIGTPAVTVQFNDSVAGQISQPFQLAANGAIVLDTQSNYDPWFQTGAGGGLNIVQSGTTPITWDLWYLQGP
jgi:hypothetical protein